MKNATMLYQHPGPHEIHGGRFDHIVVDEADVDDKLQAGWYRTTTEAKQADEQRKSDAAAQASRVADEKKLADAQALVDAQANTGPTRAELEQKAKDLGLEWHPLLGDKKLGALIDDKLQADAS